MIRAVSAAWRQRRPRVIIRYLIVTTLVIGAVYFGSNQVLSDSSVPTDLTLNDWQGSWTRVLKRCVDDHGRIDLRGLRGEHTDLDAVVAFIAQVDPTSSPARFPSADARLAYFINAYNAMAMNGILAPNVPVRFTWFDRWQFFYLHKFTMGGRSMSLYSLENDIIRPLGDPRVHFALNCMSVSCPRLPQTAFTGEGLDSELEGAAREFVNDNRNVQVDRKDRKIRLSAIFQFYTKDFLQHSASLALYVNHYRAEPVPPGYNIVFMDYDWSTNDQRR